FAGSARPGESRERFLDFLPASSSPSSLTCEALVVLRAVRAQRAFGPAPRVVAFHAREARALHGLRPAVIEALDAPLPRRPVQHQEVPLVDVALEIEVQRLTLADARRAVRG